MSAKLKGVPHLIVGGDFHDNMPNLAELRVNPVKWVIRSQAAGAGRHFRLPNMAIRATPTC